MVIGGEAFQDMMDIPNAFGFAKVSRQFLRKAAQNVLEDEVGKQLERLFGPPR